MRHAFACCFSSAWRVFAINFLIDVNPLLFEPAVEIFIYVSHVLHTLKICIPNTYYEEIYMAQVTVKDVSMLVTYLKGLGYKVNKISSKKVVILTEENRVDVLEAVAKKSGGKYDRTPLSESSVGRVTIGQFAILVKPASKQGGGSAGLGNEDMLVNTINTMCKTGPINVVFRESSTKKYTVRGCVKARSAGRDTAGRKKADVVLIDSKGIEFPISVKKDDAEMWESADTYYADDALKAINKALKSKKTQLIPHGGYFTIEPNIAVKATVEETRDVVFGSDIAKQHGAIITKTYSKSSFVAKGDTLTINVTDIITKMADVTGEKQVYFLIRNDKTRKSLKQYPGLRILAVYEKRINTNVVVIR